MLKMNEKCGLEHLDVAHPRGSLRFIIPKQLPDKNSSMPRSEGYLGCVRDAPLDDKRAT